jgi:predicted porin
MNKKLIALAVAGAIYAPTVMAQSANPVTLYGRAWGMVESVQAKDGPSSAVPIANRVRVSDQSSYFGIRGTEDIGGGVKAFFQMETAFNLDQNTTTFAARNSGVGIQAGWGSLLWGRWDTPYKEFTGRFDPFADNTAAGFAGVMNDRGNFDIRGQNIIQYWMPKIGGFDARLAYQANENKTPSSGTPPSCGTTATGCANPWGWSAAVQWAGGPFRAALAYEKHNDTIRGVAQGGTREQGVSGMGAWKISAFELGIIYQQYKTNNNQIAGLSINQQKAMEVWGTYDMGKSRFILAWTASKDGGRNLQNVANTDNTQPKCQAIAVAWNYSVTKRTTFMTQYMGVKNKENAPLYSLTPGAANANGCNFGSNPLAITVGQDPQAFAVGMRHLF